MKHNDASYEEILQSIKDIYPKKLMLSKEEVIQVTGRSLSSINRDISEGKGIPFKKSRNRVFFPITALAQYIADTVEMV